MIQLYPASIEGIPCPYCGGKIKGEILWQGIHVCVKGNCSNCHLTIVGDLPVGQALYTPYQVCIERGELFGSEQCKGWFGTPLLRSLLSPDDGIVDLRIEQFRTSNRVMILNCLDYLYGHCLLKLLNADWHLKHDSDFTLIVIIPSFLRWMVPEGVGEIWSVGLSLGKMQKFYPDLHRTINKECSRFSEISLSPAYSHPRAFDISTYTKVSRHDFSSDSFRITFIWRNDRLWYQESFFFKVMRKLGFMRPFVWYQKKKIIKLFAKLKSELPIAHYTVAGIGKDGIFPPWIDDQRLNPHLSDIQEQDLCKVYAESRVVIGVHGSNMLLPSAHAGMVIDLMPDDRWGNIIQDILYQEEDNRFASYLYRYLPLDVDIDTLVKVISLQIGDYYGFINRMMVEV